MILLFISVLYPFYIRFYSLSNRYLPLLTALFYLIKFASNLLYLTIFN